VEDEYYNEQEQWERVKAWVRENILWVIAGIAIGAAALSGWRWWTERQETRAVTASVRYGEALDAFDRKDPTRALTIIDEIRKDYGDSPYADQGDLAAARSFVETNELDKAADRLTRVMNGSKDSQLRMVARYRLARVQLAQTKADLALATFPVEAGAFTARFQELRGDILLAKGDRPGALREYLAAKTLESAPDAGQTLDLAGLDLKISDLRADGIKETAAASPAAAPVVAPMAG
jgi:predicted negative regulator of RcsB-dependent stress response